MDTRTMTMIVVAIVVIALVVLAALVVTRQRKSKHLKEQFGPEYDRTLRQHGDARRTEAILLEREKRVEKFPSALSPQPIASGTRMSGPPCRSGSSTTRPSLSPRPRS